MLDSNNKPDLEDANQAFILASVGHTAGVLAGAASVNGNPSLCKMLTDVVCQDNGPEDRTATSILLANALDEFNIRLRVAIESELNFHIHVLTSSFVEGVLNANDDIETVTNNTRFGGGSCPSCPISPGDDCGSCSGE